MENDKRIEEQFASLPLNEKLASLFKMELATITEAFNYVVKESAVAVEKFTGIVTEFGNKVETEFKEARANGKKSRESDPDKKPEQPQPATKPTGETAESE